MSEHGGENPYLYKVVRFLREAWLPSYDASLTEVSVEFSWVDSVVVDASALAGRYLRVARFYCSKLNIKVLLKMGRCDVLNASILQKKVKKNGLETRNTL